MVEGPLAALAPQNHMLVPEAREVGALARQLLDEPAECRIGEMGAANRTEFGDDAARALFPITDERAGGGLKEDEAQEIAVARLVEPSREQPFRLSVEAPRIKTAV